MRYIILFLMMVGNVVIGCPMEIQNDGSESIVVVDPYSHTLLFLKSGESEVIDPTVPGLWGYIYSEKLDIYVEQEGKKHSFYRLYQLTEKYCTDEPTKLSFKQIEQLVRNPTKRFQVVAYKAPIAHEHIHDHSH